MSQENATALFMCAQLCNIHVNMILYKTVVEERTALATREISDPVLQQKIGLKFTIPPHILLNLSYSLKNLTWLLKPFSHGDR